MGTKMEVSFANIFMAEIEMKLIQQGETKPREWKLYIDDVFFLWDCDRKEVNRFKRANYQILGRNIRDTNHFPRYHNV